MKRRNLLVRKSLLAVGDGVVVNTWTGSLAGSDDARGLDIWHFDPAGNVRAHHLCTFLSVRPSNPLARLRFALTSPITALVFFREQRRHGVKPATGGVMTDWPRVHRQVVEKFAKGWAHPHPHAWDDLLHEDVALSQPLLADVTGRDRFADEVRRLLALAPDIRGEVLDWAGQDDLVFIDLRLTGTAGRAPISFRTFDKLLVTPDAVATRRDAAFDPSPIMRSVLTHPSAWWPWFRSGIGPFAARRAILPR